MGSSEAYLQKKIIVIGAGISGLACASHLRDYGFENVLILEAKNHIGGRTHTVSYRDDDTAEDSVPGFIELGAQWIHGEDGNVIYELSHSKGLVNESAENYYEALMNFSALYSEKECEIINSVIKYFDEKTETIAEDLKKDISVSDFLEKEFTEYLLQHNDSSSIEFLKGIYDWYRKINCELSGSKNLSDLSTCLLNQYKECEGLQTVELKFGFSSILNLLFEKLPVDSILTNSVVENIDWSDFKTSQSENVRENAELVHNCNENKDMKIKVFCDNGEVYDADHVIITVPLGFLKHANTLFHPALSENKLKAIECIGFGTVNKIFLEFSEPFWEPPTVYQVMWNKSLDVILEDNEESSKSWLKHINRFAYTPGHRNMLCAWVVDEGAITMENLSTEEIAANCMELLEKLTGKKLPSPDRVLRSTWHSDPYTCGSYSYLSMECDKSSNSHIAEPEFSNVLCVQHPVLQFAGEATHPFYFSTVHGAYETGLREAQRLFEHYRNCKLNKVTYGDIVCEIHRNVPLLKFFHQNLKIVVVGAGIAGLATALSLYKKGFIQISILEAQEKIGGRVQSLAINDSFLELGAQWIHGNNNPLYEFSVENNLLCDPSDEPSCEGKGLFCTSSGYIIETSVIEEIRNMFEKTKSDLCDGLYFPSKSVLSYFLDSFNSLYGSSIDNSLYSVRNGLFNWFLKFEIIDNACDNLDEVAVQCYSEWCDIAENDYHINFKKGFSSVINEISYQLPGKYVHLNKPVKTINWKRKFIYPKCDENFWRTRSSDNFPVLIECEDEVFPADVVVVTPSVGFLKENMDTFFKPALPLNKATAFANIGFGTINKIYLIYESHFWNLHDEGFQLVWTSNLDEECKLLLKENPWITGITGFDIIRKQPNILLGWIGGFEAKMVEKVDAEVVGTVCTKLLRKFLRSADIPYPIKTIRTCWFNNKYIKGAYSFHSLKFYEQNSTMEDVQSSLITSYETEDGKTIQWPIVHFAGEATDATCFSSVHGAFQSGLKAANDIDEVCNLLKVALNTDEDNSMLESKRTI